MSGGKEQKYVIHHGGCHCGAVRFEVEAESVIEAHDCNCSICRKSGYLHLIVPAERFRLIAGSDALSEYTFNTRTARHYFCRTCGIKSFYVPRSNPEGISVNVRCLEPGTIEQLRVLQFDGENWEANAPGLAHLSE
jgi:hypothetical protein